MSGQIFYTIEVQYTYENAIKLERVRNLTQAKLIQFREVVFTAGFMVKLDESHSIVINPRDVIQIDVWRQEKFFKG